MNIIVTGAGRGIGLELVKKFAENPDAIIYAISRDLKYIQNLGLSNVKTYSIDFLKEQFQEDLNPFLETIPSIDILVNNAGFLINKPFLEITNADIQASYQVNVIAPFQLIQSCLTKLKKGSHIVNISSMGGFQGTSKFPGLSAYSSSKAAIANLTEVLAEEFKENEIVVNCLALGAVQTEMLQEAFPGYQAPTSPAQMAEYIVDFSINGSKYFNGKILPVSLSTP